MIWKLCLFFRTDEPFDHSDIHMNTAMYIYIIFLFLVCERFFPYYQLLLPPKTIISGYFHLFDKAKQFQCPESNYEFGSSD